MSQVVLAANVRETTVPTLEKIGEVFVIHAEQPEHRCVQIVDMYFVLDRVESKVVGGPDRLAARSSVSGTRLLPW